MQDTETIIMGRIRKEIDINGRQCWTLFDSGARNSYITSRAAAGLTSTPLPNPRSIKLGGETHAINDTCIVIANVEGHPLDFQAWLVDDIGHDEDGRALDVLFGALAMQLWNIKLDVPNEELDFTHFSTEFVEF